LYRHALPIADYVLWLEMFPLYLPMSPQRKQGFLLHYREVQWLPCLGLRIAPMPRLPMYMYS